MTEFKLFHTTQPTVFGQSTFSQEHSFHRIHGFSQAGTSNQAVYSSRFHHLNSSPGTLPTEPRYGAPDASNAQEFRAGGVFFDPPKIF